MKRFLLILGSVFAMGFSPAHADETPLNVVASFSVLGNMVEEIGGPDVSVKTLVGPNGDAHSYDPTPFDAKTVARAKILFINGLGFDGWIPRLASASSFKGKIVVASDTVIPRRAPTSGASSGSSLDPHAWQNPLNGLVYAENIREALEVALPQKKAEISARAQAYEYKIVSLDRQIRNDLAAIPEKKRRVITSHDAFGYFGDAYGITFLAPVGVFTDAEPSVADLTKLLAQIKKEGVKTIFLENMTNPRLAQQLAHEGGIKIGATLYSDALSETKGPAPTYLAMFEYNVPKLIEAMNENSN